MCLPAESTAMRVLVTGGNGFVGRALVARLRSEGVAVFGTVRGGADEGCVRLPPLEQVVDWSPWLGGVTTVVHTAGRVHVPGRTADSHKAFHSVNVTASQRLAEQAAAAGVRRFIFLSSVKVFGEESAPGRAFLASDAVVPCDAYGFSKHEAERVLAGVAARTGMEVVVIRPPRVYGPGVKANFLSLMRCVGRGVPLPFGSVVSNRRSLVALDNLVDLILRCLAHPAAANRIFLVSDGEDVSTASLLRRLAEAMGVPSRLFPVPVGALELGAAVLGRRAMMRRLCGNLQVSIDDTCSALGWRPPIGVDEGLQRAVAGFEA